MFWNIWKNKDILLSLLTTQMKQVFETLPRENKTRLSCIADDMATYYLVIRTLVATILPQLSRYSDFISKRKQHELALIKAF